MKKKDKEIIHKPDIVTVAFETVVQYIRDHMRQSIIVASAVVIIAAVAYGYILHLGNQDNKAQYKLSQGIQSYQEYEAEGRKESLGKAEKIFKEIEQSKRGDISFIAKLYLAKIQYTQGQGEKAKELYTNVANNASSKTLKTLSQKAIQNLEKKP